MATSKEIKDGYTSTLQDLTCNSKPLISVLTMLAEENVEHAKDIVEAIEAHIAKVRTEVKLPVLYLIDCIIKNVGGPYMAEFCTNIVFLFCSVFQVVDEKTRQEMFKLRQTWNDVLPKNKLYSLDIQTKQMDPAWPLTAPPPNIHFNPKFLKQSVNKKDALPGGKSGSMVVPVATDPATLDMQQKLIKKQRELLELQQKKLELELLQEQVKLQEQIKKNNTVKAVEENVGLKTKNLLLKPGATQELQNDSKEPKSHPSPQSRVLLSQSNSTPLPKIAPVSGALANAVRPIRDPRLLRQQQQQQPSKPPPNNTVNSVVQLENKSNNADSTKVISSKAGGFVSSNNNKDDSKSRPLSRIPLKSKRSSSPSSAKLATKIPRSGTANKSPTTAATAGSGPTSVPDSPIKPSKSSRGSPKSPSKHKKGGSSSSRADSKKISSADGPVSKTSPIKDSGFKDVKGPKSRNYIRRNRDASASPEPMESDVSSPNQYDVDLRLSSGSVGPSSEKYPRLESASPDKSMDVDLRQIPAMLGKKRTSTEAPDNQPVIKRNKSEMLDILFGNEDVDLRQLPKIGSPKEVERPPTPPPPPIISSNKTSEGEVQPSESTIITSTPQPKKENSPKPSLDALRLKLKNATTKERKTRFNQIEPTETNKPLDDSMNKIIISTAEEENIKAGNMTRAQENALMTKIIAQIENHKLNEAKRKDNEESNNNSKAHEDQQPISDDELECIELRPPTKERFTDDYQRYPGGNFDPRFRRAPPLLPAQWRGRGGFPMVRPPIRPQRRGIEPWLRPPIPANNMPWGAPFNQQQHDDERLVPSPPDVLDVRSSSPKDVADMTLSCASANSMKSIHIDGEPRDIVFYDEVAVAFMSSNDPREITFHNGVRVATFDDKESFSLNFNSPYKDILIDGQMHQIRLGAPTREIYIDGKGYECIFGGPGIGVELSGRLHVVKIDGPPPQVKIGSVKRTDLVAGKITLIVDAKNIIPVYLDARTQTFEIHGHANSLRFVDALTTVLINDIPFKVEYGGLPKPVFLNGKKHFVRFSVLPKGVRAGYVKIKNMDGVVVSDNENSQDGDEPYEPPDSCLPALPIVARKKSRFSDDDDRVASPPQLQQSNFGNFDSLLTNVLTASASVPTSDHNVSAYQVDQSAVAEDRLTSTTTAIPTVLPAVPAVNINDLFQRLVASGIVTSNSEPLAPPVVAPPPPSLRQKSPEIPQIHKSKRIDMSLKHVDFSKTSTLKARQPALIQALYSGMQCSSCGMRFPPENSMLYSQHLDWHFRQNRRGKKNIRKASSRRWYYSIPDWNNYEEIEDLDEREKCYFENQQKDQLDASNEEGEEEVEIPSVPAESAVTDSHCEVCKEKLEQFYNEEKEEWHLRMAVRHDGLTYHPLCYEDYQASLVNSTLEENADQVESEEKTMAIIPGLEVVLDDIVEQDVSAIIIDDVDSVESIPDTTQDIEEIDTEDDKSKDQASPKSNNAEEEEEEEDDDDVIINEVVPERIILDEYEFKGSVDDDAVLAGATIKAEPNDDGFTDVENLKLGPVKIKTEPITPGKYESFEDIGITDVDALTTPTAPDPLHLELVTNIDGNVALGGGGGGVAVSAPTIGSRIKINISKPLPVIAPKETNKDVPLDVDDSTNKTAANTITTSNTTTEPPIDPTQPLPPGEEPIQLNIKPSLQGLDLKRLPPVHKGSELTGLCSIM